MILVWDQGVSYVQNETVWQEELANLEWQLAVDALSTVTTLASVQIFSSVIAEDFKNTAVVAVFLSLLLILIYIWVRFGSMRLLACGDYHAAARCAVRDRADALAEILYDHPITAAVARSMQIEPFKVDLNLVAAVLTIIGYSLNDTIVIMDRIRENRGRLPYASRRIVNLSINQTISRTVITSGTTLLATLVLYLYGGAGVRAFSYALLCGVVVGTYSSIAVAAPQVWSSRKDPHTRARTRTGRPRAAARGWGRGPEPGSGGFAGRGGSIRPTMNRRGHERPNRESVLGPWGAGGGLDRGVLVLARRARGGDQFGRGDRVDRRGVAGGDRAARTDARDSATPPGRTSAHADNTRAAA